MDIGARRVKSAARTTLDITMPHMLARLKYHGFVVDEEDCSVEDCARKIAEKALEEAGEHVDAVLDDLICDIAPKYCERDPNWRDPNW